MKKNTAFDETPSILPMFQSMSFQVGLYLVMVVVLLHVAAFYLMCIQKALEIRKSSFTCSLYILFSPIFAITSQPSAHTFYLDFCNRKHYLCRFFSFFLLLSFMHFAPRATCFYSNIIIYIAPAY